MTEKIELSQPGERSPQRIHNRWLKTVTAGLFLTSGIAQEALALGFLVKAAQIRQGIEVAFSIAQEMGAVVSPELIQQVSDSAAHLPEAGAVIASIGATAFFAAGSITAIKAARR